MLFDTHVHLDQDEFAGDRDGVVERAAAAGVEAIVAVGTTAASSRACVELAARYSSVYAAVGIQPNYVAECGADDWSEIERLATQPRVVAIGETGLDRYWDYTPLVQQQEFFDRHLDLARRVVLPVIIHMRDCEADMLAALRSASKYGPVRGVMHSFTGDGELAAELVALGLHISFAGMVTYKKSQTLRACAATIPDDRLLIETDAPYLAPEPVRSRRPNEPALVRHTAECLAQVRGVSLDQLAALTTANAKRLFAV